MSKHTPGPWEPRKRYYADFDLPHWEVAYGDMEAHRLVSGYVRTEADARLIAAAPDMEAWIRAALKQFEAQAQVLINNSSIIDDANKFKEEPIVKLILSGRDILSRVEGEEAK